MPLAPHLDIQKLAHRAGEAVAAHKIGAAQGLAPAAARIAHGGGDARVILHEAFELGRVAQRDGWIRPRATLQDRIEPGLRAGQGPFGALFHRRLLRQRRGNDAADLIAAHRGDEGAVEPMVERKAPVRTRSAMPSWRQNSMVRTLTSSILAVPTRSPPCSTSSALTPRRPRSAASARPIGPPPAIRTGKSTGRSMFGTSLGGG